MINKVETPCHGLTLLVILMKKKLFWTFFEKVLKKTKGKEFRTEKVITKKAINYMLNGKDTIIRLIVGLIKKRNSINM